MRDKLSRREDRALFRALRAVLLTQFPNPERKDCPGTPVLEAIAAKRISMLDPVHEHVGSCSPCFTELTEIQRNLRHHRVRLWAMATAGSALVILAAVLTYSALRQAESPIREEVAQPLRPPQPESPAQSNGAAQPGSSTPPTQMQRPVYQMVLLDLRSASATRTVELSPPTAQRMEIPRGFLALTVQLPIGSEAGSYEIEFRRSNPPATLTAVGQAAIENGITGFLIHVDTSLMPPGEYEFTWRREGFGWRNYPILIR